MPQFVSETFLAACILLGFAGPLIAAAPVIDSVSASSTVVAPGGVINVTVEAHDPDCPDVCSSGCGLYIMEGLTIWSADGGSFVAENSGVSGSPYSATADWQAPAVEAVYTIDVQVSDSGTFLCGGRETATASIQVQVTSNPNNPPVIESLVADPPQIFPAQTSSLSCVASDPDGDPVGYAWATDFGTVTPGAAGNAVFSAATPGVATVRCTATDSSGAPASRSVLVSVTETVPAGTVSIGLAAPQRLAVNDLGEIYVVDLGAGGLMVSHLFDSAVGRFIPVPQVTSVAVDWNGDLLVGTRNGAGTIGSGGGAVSWLPAVDGLVDVADVAVDRANFRYVVLYRSTGLVGVFDAGGGLVTSFGGTGSAPGELSDPSGIAVSPAGQILVADSGQGQIEVFSSTGVPQLSFGAIGGGAGEFIQLDGVAVGGTGLIYTTDAFNSRVQVFNPDGSVRELLGRYGDGLGELKTPTGVAVSDGFERLVVASLNTPSLELYRLGTTVFQPPTASLFPSGLSFAGQLVATTSPAQTLTLANSGSTPLSLYSLSVSGDFDAVHACGNALLAGESCTIAVNFTPAAAGLRSGELVIVDSADGSPRSVALSGTGVLPTVPLVALAPRELDFGAQTVGTASAAKPITLSNVGAAGLSISSLWTSSDFTNATDCGALLSPGASCSVWVSFAPTTAGWISGILSIASDAAGSPHMVGLAGYGGEAPSAGVTPTAVAFGDIAMGSTSGEHVVTVTNGGPGLLAFSAFSATGDFGYRTTCGVSLAPGSSCSVLVSFAPTAVGPRNGELSIASNDPGGVRAVALSGTGIGVPAVAFEPAVLDFGTVFVGDPIPPQSISLRNVGEGPLAVGQLRLTGVDSFNFSFDRDLCTGVTLAPSAACVVDVLFAPRVDGVRTTVLEASSDAAGSPHVAGIVGEGDYVSTTIGTGFDPADGSACPGDPAAFVDAFSLVTERDDDPVSWLRVDLTPGSGVAVGLVEVTDGSGTVVYGSAPGTGDDWVVVPLNLTATTEQTDYFIRLTPKTHADMPPPAGDSYPLTAVVAVLANRNLTEGGDTAPTTFTVDNRSPADVLLDAVTVGEGELRLSWANPADADFAELVIFRSVVDPTDLPAEGELYAVGDIVGASRVVYVGSDFELVDTGVVNGAEYWYSIFARDECGNYSVGVVSGPHLAGSAAPAGAQIPTLGGLGMMIFVLLVALVGVLTINRRLL